MASSKARVPTANGAKYMIQLCKHWAHKLEVEQEGDTARVVFPEGIARMTADAGALEVAIEAAEKETVDRLKDVVARHLDRFAFREAPLPFDWTDG